MSNQTPQGLLLPTEMPGQGTTLCMSQWKKTSKLDAIYHLHGRQCGCWLKTGGQDQGAGTHVSYIQLVFLHSIKCWKTIARLPGELSGQFLNTRTYRTRLPQQLNRGQVTYKVWPRNGYIRLRRPEHKSLILCLIISTLPSFNKVKCQWLKGKYKT